jgi:phosphate transport system substrate-binding protein
MTESAFLEMLFAPGCDSLPQIAALEETDPPRHDRVCQTLRHDGVYLQTAETPFELSQRIQSTPNAIGVMGYTVLLANESLLAVSPVGGVSPTPETIATDSYPGSRSLYLYINLAHGRPSLQNFIGRYLHIDPNLGDTASLVQPDDPEIQALRVKALTLTDLRP